MSLSPSSKTAEDPQKPAMGRDYFPGDKKGNGDGIVLVAYDEILK
jgi:hypothetical protein